MKAGLPQPAMERAGAQAPTHRHNATSSAPPGLLYRALAYDTASVAGIAPLSAARGPWAAAINPSLQRKCSECEEEELQRKEVPGSAETSAPPAVMQVLGGGGGRPLDGPTRSYFEMQFGRDLGGVRVHTGQAASASARAVNALAYTVGNDVVFREGAFAPGSTAGRRLLAHELTHVIQQGAGGVADARPLQRSAAGLAVSDPSDRAEREADAAAEAIVRGRRAPGPGAFAPLLESGRLNARAPDPALVASEGAIAELSLTGSALLEVMRFASPPVAAPIERGAVNLLEPAIHEGLSTAFDEVTVSLDNPGRVSDGLTSIGHRPPGAADGHRLLAHELTHVVQIRDAPRSRSQSAPAILHRTAELPSQIPEQASETEAFATETSELLAASRMEAIKQRLRAFASQAEKPSDPEMGDQIASYLVDTEALNLGQIQAVFSELQAEAPDVLAIVLFGGWTFAALKKLKKHGIGQLAKAAGWYVLKTIVDTVAGDFVEDPTAAAIVLRTLLTLIPYVDQAADLEDVVASLVKLIWQGRLTEFGVWLGLVCALVGTFPAIGSAAVGVLKLGKKGVGSFVLKFLPQIPELGSRPLYGAWNGARWLLGEAAAWRPTISVKFYQIIEALVDALTRAKGVIGSKVDQVLARIVEVKRKGDTMIEYVLDWLLEQLHALHAFLEDSWRALEGSVGDGSLVPAAAGGGSIPHAVFADPPKPPQVGLGSTPPTGEIKDVGLPDGGDAAVLQTSVKQVEDQGNLLTRLGEEAFEPFATLDESALKRFAALDFETLSKFTQLKSDALQRMGALPDNIFTRFTVFDQATLNGLSLLPRDAMTNFARLDDATLQALAETNPAGLEKLERAKNLAVTSKVGSASGEWPGTGSVPQWTNPIGKAYKHVISDHGSERLKSPSKVLDRMRNTKYPQGIWRNNALIVEAESLAPPYKGEYIINMGKDVGDVFELDGTKTERVTKFFLRRGPDGMLVSAYPISDNFTGWRGDD